MRERGDNIETKASFKDGGSGQEPRNAIHRTLESRKDKRRIVLGTSRGGVAPPPMIP